MAFMIYTYIYYYEGTEISELTINKTCRIDQVTINNHTIYVQLVGRMKRKWEDNIQITFKEIGCDDARRMEQAQECNHCDKPYPHLSQALPLQTTPYITLPQSSQPTDRKVASYYLHQHQTLWVAYYSVKESAVKYNSRKDGGQGLLKHSHPHHLRKFFL